MEILVVEISFVQFSDTHSGDVTSVGYIMCAPLLHYSSTRRPYFDSTATDPAASNISTLPSDQSIAHKHSKYSYYIRS